MPGGVLADPAVAPLVLAIARRLREDGPRLLGGPGSGTPPRRIAKRTALRPLGASLSYMREADVLAGAIMSLNAYQRVQQIAATPRRNEYRLMSQITGEMIAARDAGLRGAQLAPALHRNRQAWSTFSSMCAGQGNQLPDDLRARIISIGLWVDKYTSEVITGHDTIDDLIVVNRAIIEGLANENGTGN